MSIPSPADFVRQLRQMTESRRPSAVATVVEVHAANSIGVLYRVSRAFAEFDLDVRTAKIHTLGDLIVDSFYVTDADGGLLVDPVVRTELERSLLHAVG